MGLIRKIAILGNHMPRRCGIATFTTDLGAAIASEFGDIDCFVLAMNDGGKRHAYPPRVRFEIAENDLLSYRSAADFLNVNGVDIVSLQHEYGIFGGKAGAHVLAILRELRMPVVTTLHTVLAEPNPLQRGVMNEIAAVSERLVVMSEEGAALLHGVHGVSERKIDRIPHGIAGISRVSASKDQLGVEGKAVLLTFGLLSPDKGIEYVIDALPDILAVHPDVVYIVLGATHPHIKERYGETYRLMLETRAHRLGVESSLIFHDRFVSQAELGQFLGAADIYITPYLNPAQIASGTLAYAVGGGKAVISTPYSYARELLAGGRGVLVPSRDSGAIAREVVTLLGDDEKRLALRESAAAYGQSMLWPAVARQYVQSFEHACADRRERGRTVFHAKTLAARPPEPPEFNLEHLQRMTDDTGILQHAIFDVPCYDEGYCLDDNARALHLMALVEDVGTEEEKVVRRLSLRYLAFVNHAFDSKQHRFRNFLSYDRTWREPTGSEDSHGRALWALGTVVGRAADPGRQSLGRQLFHDALSSAPELQSPRAWAFTLLGIREYLRVFRGDSSVQSVGDALAARLFDRFERTQNHDWPWFEDYATYSNARLSQALIAWGSDARDEKRTGAGLRSLAWLAKIQCSHDGYFAPIGSSRVYRRGEPKPDFDQQPIEACGMVSACLEAHRVTGDRGWMMHAHRAFGWFFGQNQLQQSLYDPTTGGCRDGLHPDRINENQGAESTLSLLLALLEMRLVGRTGVGKLQAVPG
jgi:glycosyltransferase involved in cell wall biosynthesis